MSGKLRAVRARESATLDCNCFALVHAYSLRSATTLRRLKWHTGQCRRGARPIERPVRGNDAQLHEDWGMRAGPPCKGSSSRKKELLLLLLLP